MGPVFLGKTPWRWWEPSCSSRGRGMFFEKVVVQKLNWPPARGSFLIKPGAKALLELRRVSTLDSHSDSQQNRVRQDVETFWMSIAYACWL